MRYNNNLRFLLKQEQVAEELRQGLNRQPSSKLRSSNTLLFYFSLLYHRHLCRTSVVFLAYKVLVKVNAISNNFI